MGILMPRQISEIINGSSQRFIKLVQRFMDPQEHKAFPPLQTSKKIREGKKKKKATIKNLFSLILMAKSPAEESQQAASISTQMGTGF